MASVLRKFSHGYSITLMSGKNLDGNLGFLTSHLHVEGPLSGQHFLPRFPSGPPPHEWWSHLSDQRVQEKQKISPLGFLSLGSALVSAAGSRSCGGSSGMSRISTDGVDKSHSRTQHYEARSL